MSYTKAKLIGYTQPAEEFKQEFTTIKDLVAFCARVSNPSNQSNSKTSDKLIKYLLDNKHFSPFEMASITIEVETTRDIARQLHRSFTFQELANGTQTLRKTYRSLREKHDYKTLRTVRTASRLLTKNCRTCGKKSSLS